jgi:hypothetical protein
MGTPLQNKIVTRGFGAVRTLPQSSGIVVQGYGPVPPAFVVAALERPLRLRAGQSGTKRRMRELDEVIVWAKLVTVNEVEPKKPVKGWIRAKVDSSSGYASVMAEQVSARARKAWEVIKVTATRVK